MTTYIFTNNLNTQIASAITNTDTSITLVDGTHLPASLPAGYILPLTLNDVATRLIFEVVYVTAIAGSTLTVIRGQEGTSAIAWPISSYAYSDQTAATTAAVNGNPLNQFSMSQADVGETATATTATANFHSSGAASAYDARITVTGGTSTNGQGAMSIDATTVNATGTLEQAGKGVLTHLDTSAGQAPVSITVGASPFTYNAPYAGSVSISGGSSVSISVTRATITYISGLSSGQVIHVRAGDSIAVSYASTPTMYMVSD